MNTKRPCPILKAPHFGRDRNASLRVAFITQWFPPEIEGVPLWVAEGLRDKGMNVGVVTGVPHYPTGQVLHGYNPWLSKREVVEGFRVLRVPEFPSHDSSSFRRILTLGSFAASSATLATRAIRSADVALVYSSPATAATLAMVARVRNGLPYVLFVQDLWPDSILATGFMQDGRKSELARKLVSRFADASYRNASEICVITPGMRDTLISRGVPKEKITVVFNWVDESLVYPAQAQGALRSALKLPTDAFVMLYAGNLGEAQALDSWVNAMTLVRDLSDTHLVFVGGGTQRLPLGALCVDQGLSERVHFLDPVPMRDVAGLVADADASVVSLANQLLFKITLPSKVQAALAMASPIIASCAGDAAQVIEQAGAGWVASPENPQSIADAIRAARNASPEERRSRGLAGRRYYTSEMSRELGAAKLDRVVRNAADSRQRRN